MYFLELRAFDRSVDKDELVDALGSLLRNQIKCKLSL